MSGPVDFSKPKDIITIKDALLGNIHGMLPNYESIPQEFKTYHNVWVKWQQKWFFEGLQDKDIPKPKEGIDLNKALAHLSVVQGSFEPKHEHKEAGVAYLASLWFETPEEKNGKEKTNRS
jgi:hypothetical protein